MLVPVALAGGVITLYPSISEQVVATLGRGFAPHLVGGYVLSLVGLFLADTWARDRKIERLRAIAERAERRAQGFQDRANELRFLLDVASDLDGTERIESSLHHVLSRVQAVVPFRFGFIYLLDGTTERLRVRGVCPLTAAPTTALDAVAQQTRETFVESTPLLVVSEAPNRHACPIRSRDQAIGVLVIDYPGSLPLHHQARILAVADRLGAALNGLRLRADVESKESALRHAYRELRQNGERLARSRALEEATAFGRAAGDALSAPVSAATEELRRLDRGMAKEDPLRPSLDRLRDQIREIRRLGAEFRAVGRHTGNPAEQHVNDAVIAAVDLAMPDLKRAGIEVRMTLDDHVTGVHMDEGVLVQLLTRALRNIRATLRRSDPPRRLWIETQPYGEGAKVVFRDNSAGLDAGRLDDVVRSNGPNDAAGRFRKAFRRNDGRLLQSDLRAHGVVIRTEHELGRGRRLMLCLSGVEEIPKAPVL